MMCAINLTHDRDRRCHNHEKKQRKNADKKCCKQRSTIFDGGRGREFVARLQINYRVTHSFTDLGWVILDLACSTVLPRPHELGEKLP